MAPKKKISSPSAKKFIPNMALKGSARKTPPGKNIGITNGNDLIEVTVRLRRKNAIEDYVKNLGNGNKVLTREEFDAKFGAQEKDIKLVEAFATEHDLTVVEASVSRRSVVLKGTIQHFSAAFGVYLSNYQHTDGKIFRGRMGAVKIPTVLDGIVEGVFGLDDRPQTRPMFYMVNNDENIELKPHAANISYNPNDVAKAYNYPKNVDGTGECIALIELGGGYRAADVKNYFLHLELPQPLVTSKSVDGAVNSPSTPDSADGEVALDIQVAGAVATGAKIVVYFAPNTDKGFLDAITTALHDNVNKPSVISISWGSSESNWSQQALQNFDQAFMSAAALGVTITVAAGDNGSSDGQTDGKAHVDFPASSSYVLACGGTKLTKTTETVWNDGDGWATGGGISDFFAIPDYQKKISLPASVNSKQHLGRGMPDIAANADSATGYNVLVDGQWSVIGGTSAVAPLMAGLIARINQKLKKPSGFINPKLYAASSTVFKDITVGDNKTAKAGGYSATKGWDACTGLGVPLGTVADALK